MKINKEQIKQLKEIAARLPKMYTAEGQKTIRPVTGERLIENEVYELTNGQQVSVNKTYIQKAEGGVEVNHFKRILKIARAGDVSKIKDYINEVIAVNSAHKNAMQGYMDRLKQTRI